MKIDNLMRRSRIPGVPAVAILASKMAIFVIILLGNNAMAKEPVTELRIGNKGSTLVAQNRSNAKTDSQPAGLNFYELQWPSTEKGKVIIAQGETRLPIGNVLSVTGVEDTDYLIEGMSEISINSTLTKKDLVGHDEARLLVFALFKQIRDTGWQVAIPRSIPRISGQIMTKLLLETGMRTTLDPAYMPSLQEWMQLENLTGWQFYLDRVFMRVQFTRETTLIDPLKPGAYLLSITLKSESEHFRGYVKARDRAKWKELLPSVVAGMRQKRAAMETELRSKGFAIDERYTDPPLPHFLVD
jgi:hypothetical protein